MSSDSNTSSVEEMTNTKIKLPGQAWVSRLVCQLPICMTGEENLPSQGTVLIKDFSSGIQWELPYQQRFIKIKRSDEEKRKSRRLYAQKYISQPHVQEKIRARQNDPDKISHRKEYAKKPEVKERKRVLNKRNRKIRNLLKEEKPDIYGELLTRVCE